jgi:hypothetical protein
MGKSQNKSQQRAEERSNDSDVGGANGSNNLQDLSAQVTERTYTN